MTAPRSRESIIATHHLTVRVAWHDSGWDGTVCQRPSQNSYCLALKRVREQKDDAAEERIHGKGWGLLEGSDLPPCVAESGSFLSPKAFRRVVRHPYQTWSADHAHLRDTWVDIPPYSFVATPFRWMLADESEKINESLNLGLPPDKHDNPYAWVWTRERQVGLLEAAFGRVKKGRLVFAYCKDGHPLADLPGEAMSRLIVGVGFINDMPSRPTDYSVSGPKQSFPLWERVIQHSIRRDGVDGVLIPYHAYLDLEVAPAAKEALLREIAVTPDSSNILDFSYGAEFITPDSALSALQRILRALMTIQTHKVVAGPWQQQTEWISARIAECWINRGAWPGLGSALEAFGLKYGGAICLELSQLGLLGSSNNPWALIEELVLGKVPPPKIEYAPHLAAIKKSWQGLNPDRKQLLRLLARFALTPAQARRWFQSNLRPSQVSDKEILRNPYLIVELDEGGENDAPVPLSTVDRGLLPDAQVVTEAVEPPSVVESSLDERRVRAVLADILKAAARKGDTTLRSDEILDRSAHLPLDQPPNVTEDWIRGNSTFLSDRVYVEDVPISERDDPKMLLSLVSLRDGERYVGPTLRERAKTPAPKLAATDWSGFLKALVTGADLNSGRTKAALAEQADALERVTRHRLGVLVGPAGTGKTTLLGALAMCPELTEGRITFLAPTGKARVRLQQATGQKAQTVAQFLYEMNRYDNVRQRPRIRDDLPKVRGARTVVVDEASMLTIVDLYALLLTFDLAWTERIILVGDPNQLPPIGPGRPFADLVSFLQNDDATRGALATLSTQVRGSEESGSATLQLAAWFSSDAPAPGSEDIFDLLAKGGEVGDLSLRYWTTPDELRNRLGSELHSLLGLRSPDDKEGFDRALGFTTNGVDPDSVDSFQILSPLRVRPHGTTELNRFIQSRFRQQEVRRSKGKYGVNLGDEDLVERDKVIQVRNQKRRAQTRSGQDEEILLANGELGLIVGSQRFPRPKLLVQFERRPGLTFEYHPGEFTSGSGPLELAYALTVHKAQGSEFDTVILILPRNCPVVSRELLYTALTRSRKRLVLLVEGEDLKELFELSSPGSSETGKRSTQLFGPAVRRSTAVPYAENRLHLTRKGDKVRSKSELYIADSLLSAGIEYEYEPDWIGPVTGGLAHPDFVIPTLGGLTLIWEHLGRLTDLTYRRRWEHRRRWYLENGYEIGRNLFTTDELGGFGADKVGGTIEAIQRARTG